MEERLNLADFDYVNALSMRPNSVPANVGEQLKYELKTVTSTAATYYQMGRDLPGLFKDTARQAHDAMTWELPKITSGLFPYPQTTTGVAYILGLVGTNSQRDETIIQSHTETVTAFAGGLLEMTATATGSRGPTYSNITASFEGKYTKTGLFTDDGALNTSFRVDYAADNSTTVNSNGLWTGTNLLYDGDRGRTSYTFQKPASGPGQWNADFTYDASNIGMPGSTLGLRGYAAGNGTGFSAMRGEGHVDLEAPFFSGNLSVKSHGLYSNGLFKAVADVSTSLVNVAVADDRLTTTVHTEAGTALASPTATLTMSYTGLHVFAANDKVRVRLGVGTRRGVDTGFELGGDYSLRVCPGSFTRLSWGSGTGTRASHR